MVLDSLPAMNLLLIRSDVFRFQSRTTSSEIRPPGVHRRSTYPNIRCSSLVYTALVRTLRHVGLLCAAVSLLAPAMSALAIHAHELLAFHHSAGHHETGQHHTGTDHFHGPDGSHAHRPSEVHIHGPAAPPCPVELRHDHHQHELRDPGTGVLVSRDHAPNSLFGIANGLVSMQMRAGEPYWRRSLRYEGVGPPDDPVPLPYLHCSLLI